MRKEIKELVQNNKNAYMLSRVIHEIMYDRRGNAYKLLLGYFEPQDKVSSIVVDHLGKLHPEKILYYISYGEDELCTWGFFALMRSLLFRLDFAERFGFMPVVKWGKYTLYLDPEGETENGFEQYFEPVSEISYKDIADSKNVVRSNAWQETMLRFDLNEQIGSNYSITNDEIERLSELYKKYIHLNKKTKAYIERQIKEKINNKRTLGIHVRGTDYNLVMIKHPVAVDPKEHIQKAKQLLEEGEYEQVFLATDDKRFLRMFQEAFPEHQLVFYEDVFRGESDLGVQCSQNDRPHHKYKLGLEVLRDSYTLACCDGLIAGLSQVSIGARYINMAIGRSYKDLIIFDNGIIEKSSKKALKYTKEVNKKRKIVYKTTHKSNK